jgi:hypothetical protein
MITEQDLTEALRQLHASTHPERQPGEFTIGEYAEANNLTIKKAGAVLSYLHNSGQIERPPKRYIGSNLTVVYKLPSPSENGKA